VCDFFIC
jgi:hypothetical protein